MVSVLDAPRRLDHMVLPVGDLVGARRRLDALGFTLAPDADHPFGTRNACVYLADGTFLEPLAIGQRETCETAARAGNTFVARDQAFRFRNGEEGFSAVVFGSDDADADDAAFREAGIRGGEPLAFSRVFRTPDGASAEAAFRLAFAADLRAPDLFFFACQRVRSPSVDRGSLEAHANGVTGLSEVVLCEPNPSDFQYLMQSVVRQRDVEAHSFGLSLAAANGDVTALTPEGVRAFLAETPRLAGRGLRAVGLVFKCTDITALAKRLEGAGIGHRRVGPRLVVSPAPGQGAIFAFEETA